MIEISPTAISPFTLTERFDPRAARLMMALAPTVPELNDLTTSGFGKYTAVENGHAERVGDTAVEVRFERAVTATVSATAMQGQHT